ncbi:hypothetical protein EDD16DRAFT_1599891 [Pisolithus croceorrhizus]|nr:hypothetical protein EDD16DRAFT_1599891 [Pisolithus croceorrhizus]
MGLPKTEVTTLLWMLASHFTGEVDGMWARFYNVRFDEEEERCNQLAPNDNAVRVAVRVPSAKPPKASRARQNPALLAWPS